MEHQDLHLFEVFKAQKASNLEVLLRGRVIQANHFIRVVNATAAGTLGNLKCRSICRILPSDGDLDGTLSLLSKGTLAPKKIARLANGLNIQNRHHLHMFSFGELQFWWAFTFTLNDLWATDSKHWSDPHIHLTSWLSHPQHDSSWIIDQFVSSDRPSIPHDFHIRFAGDIGQDIRFG